MHCINQLIKPFSPHARGDPRFLMDIKIKLKYSPHTRGVILDSLREQAEAEVFPAHAGGDPMLAVKSCISAQFSPHTRDELKMTPDVFTHKNPRSRNRQELFLGENTKAYRVRNLGQALW